MPTDAQKRLAAFYDEIVRRAYSGACNHWCQTEPDLAVEEGVTMVPPRGGYVRADFLDAWPTLPIGPGDTREPAFVLDRYAVEQAFTRILKHDSDITLSDDTYRVLHLAEQDADDAALRDSHVNLVVQIAVFGKIVFG
jgi:hypothetical protein